MDRFAIKISTWNGIAFCVAVGGPTFLDPLIVHRVEYGTRTYPLGFWVLVPSVLVWGLTYVVVSSKWSPINKSMLTFLALAVPTWLTMPNFLPELPHPMVLFIPIWFGIWTALSTYVKHYVLRYHFVNQTNVTRFVKVERLKMEHETWFRILLGFLAAYIAVEVAIYLYLQQFSVTLTTSVEEVLKYQVAFGGLVISNGLLFLICFVWEMLNKMRDIRERITSIR